MLESQSDPHRAHAKPGFRPLDVAFRQGLAARENDVHDGASRRAPAANQAGIGTPSRESGESGCDVLAARGDEQIEILRGAPE